MDDHIVSINQQKENTLQFDVTIDGTDASDATVRLTIDLNDGSLLSFVCIRLDGDRYEARIPVLSHIARTAYPCYIEVITNGYYFKAMKGVVNVTGSATITAQPTTIASKINDNNSTNVDDSEEDVDKETKQESLRNVFNTAATQPSLGVRGIKDAADKVISESVKTKKPEKTTSSKKTPNQPVSNIENLVEETSISQQEINDVRVKQILESVGIHVKTKRNIPKLRIKRSTD
jgi:uncharacterized protein (UPF0335 family)